MDDDASEVLEETLMDTTGDDDSVEGINETLDDFDLENEENTEE